MIEDADIRSQSAHVFTEAADSEIMEVLVRHFGEQTSMGISIDARARSRWTNSSDRGAHDHRPLHRHRS